MLLNVGSGGGAAAPAAGGAASGGAAAGGAAAEESKEEEKKEEGQYRCCEKNENTITDNRCREGRVRRGHGLRSLRLSIRSCDTCRSCINFDLRHVPTCPHAAFVINDGWKRAILEKDSPERAKQLECLLRLMRTTRACSETPLMTILSNMIFPIPRLMRVVVTTARSMLVLMSTSICLDGGLRTRHFDVFLLSLNHHLQYLHNLLFLSNLDRICQNPVIFQRMLCKPI